MQSTDTWIAFQAGGAVWIKDDIFHLKYLPEEPEKRGGGGKKKKKKKKKKKTSQRACNPGRNGVVETIHVSDIDSEYWRLSGRHFTENLLYEDAGKVANVTCH